MGSDSNLRAELLPTKDQRWFGTTLWRTLLLVVIALVGFVLPLVRSSQQIDNSPPDSTTIQGQIENPISVGHADAQVSAPTNLSLTPQNSQNTSIKPTLIDSEDLTPTAVASQTPLPNSKHKIVEEQDDIIILSLDEGNTTHLFAYHPAGLQLTRLTQGPWRDIHPTISPDGQQIAFASNRDGFWDLYLLSLTDGEVIRLTETPEYDAHPSWSPDGLWLVYETYHGENLEIFIRPLESNQPPTQLTANPAADYSPSWSPEGRKIAFISHRSGDGEVWIADLDQVEANRMRNISQSPETNEAYPAWSPNGEDLVWSTSQDGLRSLYIWRGQGASPRTAYVGSGEWPTWSPDGETLLTRLSAPNQTYLTGYFPHSNGALAIPPFTVNAHIAGLSWGQGNLPTVLPKPFSDSAEVTPTMLWQPITLPDADLPEGRHRLVELENLSAPVPQLHDLVDESFVALRAQVASAAGWDLLSTLENAFVPLTSPLSPGLGADWLYTGRAFSFTSAPLSAGWVVLAREKYGDQTYWRVYLKARFQDGSQGMPITSQTWDIDARFRGDPAAYEQGGKRAENIPPGYWVDFTRLAAAYGWERLAALPTWRTFYQGARFNEFVLTSGLDWRSAMLELYPQEILITPTVIVPPTRTPSPTPRWYRTPTPTLTPTPIPTFTPSPMAYSPDTHNPP